MSTNRIPPALALTLSAGVLAATIVLLRAPYWPLYPMVLLCGAAAWAYGGRVVRVVVLLIASALGPLAWHLCAARGAGRLATVLHDAGLAGMVEYGRVFVFDGIPHRAWLLLPCVAALGFVATALAMSDTMRRATATTARTRRLLVAACVAGAGLVAAPRVLLRIGEARSAWRAAERAREEERRFVAQIDASLPRLDRTPLVGHRDVDVVLYVGESTTLWNWSLYGYPRATSEPIARGIDAGRMLALSGVAEAAPGGSDRSSLPSFLYERVGSDIVPLTHVLARAGIRTVWLRAADVSPTGGALAGDTSAGVPDRSHDEALVAPLHATLSDSGGGRLVVLQSRTGSFPWCDGVPPTQRVDWNDWMAHLGQHAIWGRGIARRAALDCYDAAMRYVSTALNGVMRAVDGSSRAVVLLYAPNRGQDVWVFENGDDERRSPRESEVPILVYVNAPLAQRYPELLTNARRHLGEPVATAWLHDAVLDAFGVTSANGEPAFDARRSIFDERFTPADRPSMRTRDSTGGRLCAHRGNSLLKFLEGRAAYDCVELDVVLDTSARGDGEAFVYHPPTADPRLPLYALLARAGIPPGGLWLDVKNLDERNASAFLSRLSAIVPREKRARVLIESSNDVLARAPGARAFGDSGFVLSYYLPTDLGCRCSRGIAGDCLREAAGMVEWLQGGAFRGLSFDARGRLLARFLRDRVSPRPVLNAWTPMGRCDNGDLASPLSAPARDSLLAEVQKYLVRLPSAFDYRRTVNRSTAERSSACVHAVGLIATR